MNVLIRSWFTISISIGQLSIFPPENDSVESGRPDDFKISDAFNPEALGSITTGITVNF